MVTPKSNLKSLRILILTLATAFFLVFITIQAEAESNVTNNLSVDSIQIDTDKNSSENQQELSDGSQQDYNEAQNTSDNKQSYGLGSNVPASGTAGHTWKFYGSGKGSSKSENTMSNEIVGLITSILTSGGTTVATASEAAVKSVLTDELTSHLAGFFNPPTYYWWASTWKDKDATTIYTRHHVKIYSDSSRNDKISDFWSYQTF